MSDDDLASSGAEDEVVDEAEMAKFLNSEKNKADRDVRGGVRKMFQCFDPARQLPSILAPRTSNIDNVTDRNLNSTAPSEGAGTLSKTPSAELAASGGAGTGDTLSLADFAAAVAEAGADTPVLVEYSTDKNGTNSNAVVDTITYRSGRAGSVSRRTELPGSGRRASAILLKARRASVVNMYITNANTKHSTKRVGSCATKQLSVGMSKLFSAFAGLEGLGLDHKGNVVGTDTPTNQQQQQDKKQEQQQMQEQAQDKQEAVVAAVPAIGVSSDIGLGLGDVGMVF